MVPAVRSKIVGDVVTALLASGAHSAIKYLEPGLVVKATRPTVRVKKRSPKKLNGTDKRDRRIGVVVTIGEPNWEAREFVKKCRRAGEPFPVKRIQLRYLPGQ